jgi:hypothetical protein
MSSVAGQNHQYCKRKDDEDSPLLVACILTFAPLTRISTTSSLNTATAHYKVEQGSTNNQKCPAKSPSSDNSPSLVKKKMLANFDVR